MHVPFSSKNKDKKKIICKNDASSYVAAGLKNGHGILLGGTGTTDKTNITLVMMRHEEDVLCSSHHQLLNTIINSTVTYYHIYNTTFLLSIVSHNRR